MLQHLIVLAFRCRRYHQQHVSYPFLLSFASSTITLLCYHLHITSRLRLLHSTIQAAQSVQSFNSAARLQFVGGRGAFESISIHIRTLYLVSRLDIKLANVIAYCSKYFFIYECYRNIFFHTRQIQYLFILACLCVCACMRACLHLFV